MLNRVMPNNNNPFKKNFPEEEWNVRKNPLHNRTKKNNKPKSKRPHATRKASNAPIFNFNLFKGGDGDAAARRVLGVNSNANSAAIRKAYHKKSRSAHPNKGGSKEEFQRLQAAYEFLTGERNSFENNAPENRREEVRTPPPEPAAPKRSIFRKAKGVDPYAGMTKEEVAAAEKKFQNAFKEANAAYRRPEVVPPHMRGVNPGTRGMAEKIGRAGRFNMGNGKMGPATWNYLHSKRGGATRRKNKA